MKTRFASHAILFQETFECMNVINICHKWQMTHLQAEVLNGQTWTICKDYH
jgi:hypothetical protein